MSRARVRSRGAVNRGRRTPIRAAGRGPRIPWVPVIVVAGIVAVIAGIIFIVLQSGKSSKDFSAGIAAEQDASTSLPGKFIDLEKIYGDVYPKTAGHVSHAVDYAHDCAASDPTLCNTNPPVGGPHWSGACGEDPTAAPAFCGPAPRGIYRQPWQAGTLVHNMEHGGVVIWYNTTDQQVISDLEALVTARLKSGDLVVLAPYPDMEAATIALTSWTRIDKFPVAQYDKDRVDAFIKAHLKRFNPEHI
jgi:hypothetical protein